MACNFYWNAPTVLEDLISIGRELQTDDPLSAKLFWPWLDFNLGGLKLKLEPHKVLLVIVETLVNFSLRLRGASALSALQTVLVDSCFIISEILGKFNYLSRGPTDTSYGLFKQLTIIWKPA